MHKRLLAVCIVAFAANLGTAAAWAFAGEQTAATRLPDAVTKTFKKMFPKGEIAKLDVEQENGVTVYDIEFKDGRIDKETDIAADGTMLEFTIVVDAEGRDAIDPRGCPRGENRADRAS